MLVEKTLGDSGVWGIGMKWYAVGESGWDE